MRAQRHLTVNDETLPIADLLANPNKLYEILNLGRTAILEDIEVSYQHTLSRNPGAKVSKAPVRVARLGTNSQRKRILSPLGQSNGTNIHRCPNELHKKYHPLFDVINHAGFMCEVRSNFSGPGVGGIWLMLRNPEVDQKTLRSYFNERYPDLLTCEEVLPDIAEGVAPIWLVDRTDRSYTYTIPSAAITRLTPPRLSAELNTGTCDSVVGMGFLACRIIDTEFAPGVMHAEFPTTGGPKQLYLPRRVLPQGRPPRTG